MPKIGVMGGTFDPVHNAHVCMAQKAAQRLGLAKVVFVPGGNPPHKAQKNVTDKDLRFEMVKAATAGNPVFEVTDYEIKKKDYSYTADTLRYMTKMHPENKYYFIMGADSLDYIEKWHEPQVIFALAEIVVFARKNFELRRKAHDVMETFGGHITILDDEIPDISSTRIREDVDMGFDISAFVPHGAEEIIQKNGLYRGELTQLREKIKSALEKSRFGHTMGVCRLAVQMAQRFGENRKKAYTAALLHDCAKNIPKDKMYEMCREYGVGLDEFELCNPALVHAKLGAYLAEHAYGIKDPDIINAVKWHTLGRCEMSRLEKIIFVADMAEEGRRFEGALPLRKAALQNLDKAVYMCADATIRFNEGKGNPVHKNAYAVRDCFKKLCCD